MICLFTKSLRISLILLVSTLTFHSCTLGQVTFLDVASSAGLDHYVNPHPFAQQRTGGVVWFDFNNDGWEDLYLTGAGNGDKLYQNQGNGQFLDVSSGSGIASITNGIITLGVAAGDLNRDGHEDLVVSTDVSSGNLVLINDGSGMFSEQSLSLGLSDISFSMGVSLMDFNKDGWLDVYFANWLDNPLLETTYPNRLYQNDGDGSFSDVTNSTGLYSNTGAGNASCFTDYDSDGDLDLFVVNDYGVLFWTDQNQLFENGTTGFTDISNSSGANLEMFGFGVACGDYDEDGDYDYYLTKIGSNVLLRNDLGSFTDQASVAGIESRWNVIDSAGAPQFTEGMSWGNSFFDYNNDSYLDLFVSNGRLPLMGEEQITIDENRLYRNENANGTFSDVSVATGMNHGLTNKGCAAADYDQDGDVDMVIVTSDTVNGGNRTLLMNNQGENGNNWVEFDLVGVSSNIEAIGATVKIHFNGRILMREIDSGGGSYLSQHSRMVHFGLGQNQSIDSVSVIWPSGTSEVFVSASVNQRTQLVEGTGALVTGENSYKPFKMSLFPNPTRASVQLQATFPNVSSVLIVNMAGKKYYEGDLSCFEVLNLDLRSFSSGIYSVMLIDKDGAQVSASKLNVQKQD